MGSGFAGLLQSIAGPIAKRVLISLGFGIVSYAGLQTAFTAAQSALTSAYGAITGDIAGILGLAGFGQAIGVILGAMAARIAFMQVSKLQLLAK